MITERTRVPPRYRLLEEVGQGGMAIVYRAEDESLKRQVAIKILHPHLSAEPESKARLEREARAVAKLKHPNILEIFDYSGGDAENAFIVTEFIDGQTLRQFLSTRRVKHPEVAALIAVELGSALAHAHGLGIIHRDIKPENVMVRKDGVLKLMDFGIAQVLDLERMTVTGQLLGSPAYMAPELIEGRPLDVRTDVFSVGILLYQIATGSLPFSGKNPHEVLRRITEGKYPDARGLNRLCGAGLAKIFARAMARDPADRYPQMGDFVADLRDHLDEAGLGEASEELRAFFADPDAYEAGLPARMTPALATSAERHLALGASSRAIECWNRALDYAPHDPGVLAALRRWQGRVRRRRIARYVAASAVAVALLGALAVAVISRRPEPATVGQVPILQTPPDPQPRPGFGEQASGPVATAGPGAGTPSPARSAVPRPPRSRAIPDVADDDNPAGSPNAGAPGVGAPEVDPAIAAGAPTRTFTLGPTPQNVDVYLDGERQFSYDTDHRVLNVPWAGNHVVEFRSPAGCCFPERIEVGPDRSSPPDNIIARKLKWKPARLVVTTTPLVPKTRVMVRDPAHPGHGVVVEPGEEANVAFFMTDEGQKEIEVSVDSPAGVAAERVAVRAGETKSVVLTLGTPP